MPNGKKLEWNSRFCPSECRVSKGLIGQQLPTHPARGVHQCLLGPIRVNHIFTYLFILCFTIVSKTKSSQLKSLNYKVELHNVPRSALSRVLKEFITRDKVPRNTSWKIILEGAGGPDWRSTEKLAPQLRNNCQSTAQQLFCSCPAKTCPLMHISLRP